MKTLFTPVLLFCSLGCFAQVTWSSSVTVATNTYSNLHPRIVLDRSGNPLVAWGNSGTKKVHFARWTGSAFSTPLALNPSMVDIAAMSWSGPDITAFGDTVYVSMKQAPEDTGHMFLARSVNGGMNFSTPVRIDNIGMNVSRFPILATDNIGNPIVAFMKFNTGFGNARYVVEKSADWGNTFSADVLATKSGDSVCDCCPASIISSGNNIVMSYRANKGNIRDMWSCISTNGGTTFPNSMTIDQTNWMIMSCPSSGPDVVVAGDSLYSVFMSGAGGKSLVYFNRGSVSMASAATQVAITGDFAGLNSQNFPRIANAGTAMGMLWVQNISGTTAIVMKFTDSISKGFPVKYDTIALSGTTNADIIMSQGTIHIVWQDDNNGTVKYRKGTYPIPPPPSSVPELQRSIPVSISPNPASDYFSVSLSDIGDLSNCMLVDNAGKRFEVKPYKENGKIIVPVKYMANGSYTVLFSDGNGKNYYANLVIQNK